MPVTERKVADLPPQSRPAFRSLSWCGKHGISRTVYRHGFLGQPGECIHAAGVSANARRTTAGARKPSRSINH